MLKRMTAIGAICAIFVYQLFSPGRIGEILGTPVLFPLNVTPERSAPLVESEELQHTVNIRHYMRVRDNFDHFIKHPAYENPLYLSVKPGPRLDFIEKSYILINRDPVNDAVSAAKRNDFAAMRHGNADEFMCIDPARPYSYSNRRGHVAPVGNGAIDMYGRLLNDFSASYNRTIMLFPGFGLPCIPAYKTKKTVLDEFDVSVRVPVQDTVEKIIRDALKITGLTEEEYLKAAASNNGIAKLLRGEDFLAFRPVPSSDTVRSIPRTTDMLAEKLDSVDFSTVENLLDEGYALDDLLRAAAKAGNTEVTKRLNARKHTRREALELVPKPGGSSASLTGKYMPPRNERCHKIRSEWPENTHQPVNEARGMAAEILIAVTDGDIGRVQQLLKNHPDLKHDFPPHKTPLRLATESGNVDMVRFLLEKGCADPNDHERMRKPIHIAAKHGHLDIIKLLLKNGGEIDVVSGHSSQTAPLVIAINEDHTEIVDYLLELGADPNFPEGELLKPIHAAAGQGNTAIIKTLLDHGVDVNADSLIHGTALHYLGMPQKHSGTRRSPETVEQNLVLLLKKGAHINKISRNGKTPLHAYMYHTPSYDRRSYFTMLLEHGADPDVADKYGRTPLHYLATSGHYDDNVQDLLRHGARSDIPDIYGNTAIDYALYWGERRPRHNRHIVRLIKKYAPINNK